MIDKMKKFTCVQDIGDLKSALAEAFEIQKDRFKYVELGRNKTLMMIFFNSSLRTRLSAKQRCEFRTAGRYLSFVSNIKTD